MTKGCCKDRSKWRCSTLQLRTLRDYTSRRKGVSIFTSRVSWSQGKTKKSRLLIDHHPYPMTEPDIHADRSCKQAGWEPRHGQKLEWRWWWWKEIKEKNRCSAKH
ncbi:hypothetical protein PISMIDRAFT_255025 [Pisolithus microcarpus 441]|uniref:Unplaced genomic scaffold scaffold_166, whole genome shotgun sequence n=1 Tax=Pisolithus microcarpus 441 TaxID=765257 RepID=A0A0C9XW52_9AGAM|nr:hypothetical protein PISMIDRAFT_255025 [Pisolithus microcarpus 441]